MAQLLIVLHMTDNGTVYSGSPGNAYYYTGEIDMFEGQGSVLDMLEDKLELWLAIQC